MPGRADRVAHVVQRVEEADQVEAPSGMVGGRAYREAHPVRDPGRCRVVDRGRDRGLVHVDAEEGRVREGFGHQHRRVAVAAADVVIVPSMAVDEEVDWVPGRYPAMVAWIRAMYERGATVCSACTGAMLAAETGLLDGHEATIHWVAEAYFRERHPDVVLRLDEVLVVSGDGGRLVTSGAADRLARPRALPGRAPRRARHRPGPGALLPAPVAPGRPGRASRSSTRGPITGTR